MAFKKCSCFAHYTPPTPCPKLGECLKACHMLVLEDDSVYPCGETGVISMTNKVLLSNNGEAATYRIKEHTPNLTGVSITAAEVTFTSNYDPNVEGSSYKTAQITYEVTQGDLRTSATIDIIFKSRCKGVVCPDGICDPCTGDCIYPDAEVLISDLKGNEIKIF